MPTYDVTDPQTGTTLQLEGDSPPTEGELTEIFSKAAPEKQPSISTPEGFFAGRNPEATPIPAAEYDATRETANPLNVLFESLIPKTTEAQGLRSNARQMALAEEVSPTPAGDVAEAPVLTGKAGAIAEGVAKGVVGTINDLGDFMSSPAGIATLGTGYLPKVAQRLIAAGFAYTMGKAVPEVASELGTEFGKPEEQRDYTKISELVTKGAAAVGFTTAAATHALAPKTSQALAVEEKGAPNAIETRQEPAGNQPEYTGVETQRLPGETIGGNRVEPVTPEQAQPGAPASAAGVEQVKPEVAAKPTPPPGERLVTIQRPDGSTYEASFGDKYWDWPGQGKVASIATLTPKGEWSHGMIKPGEVILESKALSERGTGTETPVGEQPAPTVETELVGMGGATAGEKPPTAELAQFGESLKTLAESNPKGSDVGKAFDLGQTIEKGKDAVSSALSGLKSAGQYLKERFINKPVWNDSKDAIGQRHLELTESAVNGRKFAATVAKAIPSRRIREAINNWIDTGGDSTVLDKAAAETKGRYKAGYEDAKKLTPEQQTIAQNTRNYFESRLQEAIDAGVLEDGIENYIHRIYETDSPWKNGVLAELRSGVFTGKPNLAKKRVFQYDFEAEKTELHPVKDFTKRVLAYDMALNKAIADRKLVKNMADITMPDGRPMIDIAGVGIPVEKGGVTDATLIKPQSKTVDANDPVANRGDYKPFDHPALRRWKWAASDSDGKPIFVQGDVLVHPDAMKQMNAVFGRSLIRANRMGRAALGVSNTIKQTMLDLSAFHPTQITVHGWEHRTFKPVKEIDFTDADTRGLIKGGLVAGETTGHELFSEGLTGSSLTRHIPYLGERLQKYNSWLFNDYIPRLKVAMGKHALERNRERYPNLSKDELYHLTANQANAAFGELNYEMLGRNKTLQDALRLGLLAPDFLEARGRFAAQAGTKYGKEQFAALALGAATMYITARIINKLLSGEYHMEPKNAFSVVYNNKAYSLRTVQGDLLHAASEPGRFVYNRLNPVYGRTALEFMTGRDAFGRKRDLVEQAKDFATTPVPISLKGALNPREQDLFESFLNSIGITERRSSSIGTIYQMAQKWKEDNKVKAEPGEFIYDPDKDPYRGVRQAALYSSPETVANEIEKAAKDGTQPQKILAHFQRGLESSFTGSRANDTKFIKSLSEDNKKLVADARKEKREEWDRFKKGYHLYVTRKAAKAAVAEPAKP